jgi:hypothetical protein
MRAVRQPRHKSTAAFAQAGVLGGSGDIPGFGILKAGSYYLAKGNTPMAEQHTYAPAAVLDSETAEIFLEGGPNDIPRRLVVTREQVAEGKVKVPYLAGYEHFVRKITDDAEYLFSWSVRTKVAE